MNDQTTPYLAPVAGDGVNFTAQLMPGEGDNAGAVLIRIEVYPLPENETDLLRKTIDAMNDACLKVLREAKLVSEDKPVNTIVDNITGVQGPLQ